MTMQQTQVIPYPHPQLNEITTETKMSFESYTQHMPTLQRTTFWSNYMSGLKGNNETRVTRVTVVTRDMLQGP